MRKPERKRWRYTQPVERGSLNNIGHRCTSPSVSEVDTRNANALTKAHQYLHPVRWARALAIAIHATRRTRLTLNNIGHRCTSPSVSEVDTRNANYADQDSPISAPGALGPSVSDGIHTTANALAKTHEYPHPVHKPGNNGDARDATALTKRQHGSHLVHKPERWRYTQRDRAGRKAIRSISGAQARALAMAIHSTDPGQQLLNSKQCLCAQICEG
jgi:hypothetical protein